METGMVRLICPNLLCRSVLCVPDSTRGKEVKCKACSKRVVIPMKAIKPKEITVVPPEKSTT